MKTVKKGRKIERHPDKDAASLVREQGWKYCPRSEWREKVRDAEPKKAVKKTAKKAKRKTPNK